LEGEGRCSIDSETLAQTLGTYVLGIALSAALLLPA
jgi:hypothetical protein